MNIPIRFLLLFCVLICKSCLLSAVNGHDLNIVILGDSNTSIGGDDCTNPKGWTKWFADKISPKTCKSYARSGATWTNTVRTRYDIVENTQVLSDNNVIFNQMNRLITACDNQQQPSPDLILIAAGTNDAWFNSKRPGIFSKTLEQAFGTPNTFNAPQKVSSVVSLAGSVKLICEKLMSRFPDAQIVLLSPMQTTKASYDIINKVGNILEECAHRMSIPIIRQDYITGVYSSRETNGYFLTVDGTHTSERGARRNGYLIANLITALLCY